MVLYKKQNFVRFVYEKLKKYDVVLKLLSCFFYFLHQKIISDRFLINLIFYQSKTNKIKNNFTQ
jgi:hypothetical protein